MAVTQSNDSPTKNYAVMTPIYPDTGTFSKGNLTAVTAGNDGDQPVGSIAFDSEDSAGYYFIMRPTTTSSSIGAFAVGVATVAHAAETPRNDATNAGSWFFNCGNGNVTNTSAIANGTWDSGGNGGISLNHYVQVAVKAGKIYFGVNNTWYDSSDGTFANAGHAFNNLTGFVVPMFQHAHASAGTVEVQFGADGFTYAAPSGFKEITAAKLYSSSAPAIGDGSAHFQTIAEWSGNSSSQTVSQTGNSGFQPDIAIIKSRSFGNGANIYDAVRGGNKGLATFDSGAEDTESDGVTFGISSDKGTLAFTGAGASGDINNSGRTYCAWTWDAGDSNTAVSASGSGDDAICACTHRANTTSGISIIKYTGRNSDISNGQHSLVTHGLGVAPKVVWGKNLAAGNDWYVMGTPLANDSHLHLNDTPANNGSLFVGTFTDSTSTHFTVGNDDLVNKNGDEFISYAFAEIPGFSNFGTYKGNNNANGTLVSTGFKPSWILVKKSSGTGAWGILDNGRQPDNPLIKRLFMNDAAAEDEDGEQMDFLSNGFKLRKSGGFNDSGATYFYMAFAEHPFAGEAPGTAF